MIQVQHLSFEYPSKRALDDINIHIPAGSITALVGPNGAGKSTLLRCLAALYRPYSGKVEINGHDTQEAPRRVHQSLGYLSDFFGLYEELSVRRSLLYACRTHGVGSEQVELTVKRLGLHDWIDKPAGTLSRGLRQRLAIGLAIIHQPKVLLLDEPASGLDPEARISLGELFLQLRDQGMTLLVSSHILSELADYASDVLIIDQGRLLEHQALSGKAAEVRLRLELATPDERLPAILAQETQISLIQSDPQEAIFNFAGDTLARSALLGRLLGAGLAVASFAQVNKDLQEVYVERIRQGRQERTQ
jgi:ABC-2 type transport system ATP-binding protein